WNNSDVTVSFTCADALSAVASCAGPTTLSSDGAAQSVTGTASDNAGNTASATVSGINIGKTQPVISATAKTADDASYTSGTWTNQTVTVHFDCADAGSGIAGSCPSEVTESAEGTYDVSGSVSDIAGNSSASQHISVRIDKTPPTITATATTADGASYTSGSWTRQTVTVHFACADAGGSGLAGACPGDVSKSADGSYDVFATVSDVAGNSASSAHLDVRVDKTPPTITGAASPAANAAGW